MKHEWQRVGADWAVCQQWDYVAKHKILGGAGLQFDSVAFVEGMRGKYSGKVYRQHPLENILFNNYESLEEIKHILETTVELLE